MNQDSITFEKYFDIQIRALEKVNDIQELRYQEKFEAQQMAIKLAADFLEHYKGFTNEKITRMDREINMLKEGGGEIKGRKEGVSATWTVIIAIISLIIGALGLKIFT